MKRTTTLLILLLAMITLSAQEIAGTWTGAISIPQGQLRIMFNISEADDGYTSTLDSPDQNAFGIPVDTTLFENSVLTLKVNQIDFRYVGRVVEDHEIKGQMKQMGQTLELNLTKKEE